MKFEKKIASLVAKTIKRWLSIPGSFVSDAAIATTEKYGEPERKSTIGYFVSRESPIPCSRNLWVERMLRIMDKP